MKNRKGLLYFIQLHIAATGIGFSFLERQPGKSWKETIYLAWLLFCLLAIWWLDVKTQVENGSSASVAPLTDQYQHGYSPPPPPQHIPDKGGLTDRHKLDI